MHYSSVSFLSLHSWALSRAELQSINQGPTLTTMGYVDWMSQNIHANRKVLWAILYTLRLSGPFLQQQQLKFIGILHHSQWNTQTTCFRKVLTTLHNDGMDLVKIQSLCEELKVPQRDFLCGCVCANHCVLTWPVLSSIWWLLFTSDSGVLLTSMGSTNKCCCRRKVQCYLLKLPGIYWILVSYDMLSFFAFMFLTVLIMLMKTQINKTDSFHFTTVIPSMSYFLHQTKKEGIIWNDQQNKLFSSVQFYQVWSSFTAECVGVSRSRSKWSWAYAVSGVFWGEWKNKNCEHHISLELDSDEESEVQQILKGRQKNLFGNGLGWWWGCKIT